MRRNNLIACVGMLFCGVAGGIAAAGPQHDGDSVRDRATQILAATGTTGGLVVHLGCADGKLTAALRANNAFTVQGLDTDAENVAVARRLIESRGLYGPVSVEPYSGKRLPYVDNLVRLLVAEDRAELRLESPPTWDGMAVANGRLHIALQDGRVLCLGSQ